MANETNRIAEHRKRLGLSQQQLAEKVGSHWITISKLERGKMQITGDWMRRLSDAMGIEMAALLPRLDRPSREVQRAGYISDDGTADIIPKSDRETFALPAEGYDDPFSYWLECRDEAMPPYFGKHDFLRFVAIENDGLDFAIGRLCHVKTHEGEDLIGFVAEEEGGTISISLPGRRSRRGVTPSEIGIAVEAKFAIPGLMADIAD